MKLTFSKSKNSTSLYIQKSFRKNGKSTSKIVRKLGTMEELLPKHNNSEEEVIAWGRKIAKKILVLKLRLYVVAVISREVKLVPIWVWKEQVQITWVCLQLL